MASLFATIHSFKTIRLATWWRGPFVFVQVSDWLILVDWPSAIDGVCWLQTCFEGGTWPESGLIAQKRPFAISEINTGGICPFIYPYRSYLSRLGVTPRISQDERSSVITHESTPSVSMMIALEHRSRVKRTSCKSEQGRAASEARSISAPMERVIIPQRRLGSGRAPRVRKEAKKRKEKRRVRFSLTLLLLRTSRRCQRLSATPMLFASWRTKVPEPWFIFRLGVPPISSGRKRIFFNSFCCKGVTALKAGSAANCIRPESALGTNKRSANCGEVKTYPAKNKQKKRQKCCQWFQELTR